MTDDDSTSEMSLLLCEDLFLLLTTDTGSAEGFGTQRGVAMAVAVVLDLIEAGRVSVGDDKDQRVHVIDPTPTGVPALDQALGRLAESDDRKLSSLIRDRKLNVADAVGDRLVDLGVLSRSDSRLGGLVAAKYPTVDAGPEQALRQRIAAAVTTGQASEHDLTALAIVDSLRVAWKVLGRDLPDLNRRELSRRIEELAADIPASDAVAQARRQVTAILASASAVAAVAGGS